MTKKPSQKIKNFHEFWVLYVKSHQDKRNQVFHFLGLLIPVFLGLAFTFWHKVLLLVGIPVVTYGLAWLGHFLFEKNKPLLALTHPVYSFLADYKMFFLMCSGKMSREVAKYV